MNEMIPAGDDEADLCSASVFSQRIVILIGLIALACMAIIFQQSTKSFIVWHSPVAHADTTHTDGLCNIQKSFSESLQRSSQQSSRTVCDILPTTDYDADIAQLSGAMEELVAGYPLAAMVPAIAKQERRVAAFLVGIAKKESDWGNHAPHKDGWDCFNYWGYKGQGGHGSVVGGYACFASPEEAVQTVGARLSVLIDKNKLDTPSKMLAWKCGSSCAGHSPESVASWAGTVNTYFTKLIANTRG